jgi:hypothetical protein
VRRLAVAAYAAGIHPDVSARGLQSWQTPTVSPSPSTYSLTRSPRRIVRPQITHASYFGFASVTAAT